MNAAGCPDAEVLCALLESDADEGSAEYSEHLETCPCCQRTLADLAADGSTWQDVTRSLSGVKAHATGRSPTSEQTLQRGLAQLKTELPLLLGKAAVESGEDLPLFFLQPADRPGVLGLLGTYEILEVIGQGGMGIVLKAFDPALQRLVAIKVPTSVLAGSAHARRRFIREARAAAAVSHEQIVPVHGVHEVDGLPYLVMQFIEGESLQARLDRTGPLPIKEVVDIGLQTARGLAAAHAQGLIHRDIKPANLLLEDGLAKVKITDFGLARLVDDVGLTQTGVVAGTPEYMAPEQACGEPVDHRADLFSLGSVLYALCTGVPPYRAATPLAVLRQVSDAALRPVRSLNPEVPAWLEVLITRLLAKDPADRYQSAAEVSALLEDRRNGLDSPGWFSILKNRSVVASVLALAVVAGVCSWLFWPTRLKDYSFLNGTLGNQFIPEVEESGFYQEEYSKAGNSFRWTDGKGRLVIPIDRHKPPTGLVVELDIIRPAEAKTAWVQVVANNRVLIKQLIPLWEWQGGSAGKFPAKLLDLTGIDLGDELVLVIISDTFIPTTDQRTLGVLVNGVELRHEAPAPQ